MIPVFRYRIVLLGYFIQLDLGLFDIFGPVYPWRSARQSSALIANKYSSVLHTTKKTNYSSSCSAKENFWNANAPKTKFWGKMVKGRLPPPHLLQFVILPLLGAGSLVVGSLKYFTPNVNIWKLFDPPKNPKIHPGLFQTKTKKST